MSVPPPPPRAVPPPPSAGSRPTPPSPPSKQKSSSAVAPAISGRFFGKPWFWVLIATLFILQSVGAWYYFVIRPVPENKRTSTVTRNKATDSTGGDRLDTDVPTKAPTPTRFPPTRVPTSYATPTTKPVFLVTATPTPAPVVATPTTSVSFNREPRCTIMAVPDSGTAPLNVFMGYFVYNDPDPGSAPKLQWDFDGDGNWDSNLSEQNTSQHHTFGSVGTHTVRLKVVLSNGTEMGCDRTIQVQ